MVGSTANAPGAGEPVLATDQRDHRQGSRGEARSVLRELPFPLYPHAFADFGVKQPHLYVVKEDGEPSLRQWALSLLIEDRMDQLPSYNQWIGQLKDKVRFCSSRYRTEGMLMVCGRQVNDKSF